MTGVKSRLLVGLAVLTVAAACLSALPALAAPPLQEATPIGYGETVAGEITDSGFEQVYTLNGTAGDVVAITVTSTDENYLDGYLIVQDSSGAILAEIDDVFGLDPFYMAALEADGAYTIIVTRMGGRTGSSTGAYELSVDLVSLAAWETPAALALNEPEESRAYVIFEAEEGQTATLSYQVVSGDLRPDLKISHFGYDDLWEESRYDEVLLLQSTLISGATLTVEFPAAGLYTVSVERPWTDWEGLPGTFEVMLSASAE